MKNEDELFALAYSKPETALHRLKSLLGKYREAYAGVVMKSNPQFESSVKEFWESNQVKVITPKEMDELYYNVWIDEFSEFTEKEVENAFGIMSRNKFKELYESNFEISQQELPKEKPTKVIKPQHKIPFWANNWRKK
jgi:hypothetical protein